MQSELKREAENVLTMFRSLSKNEQQIALAILHGMALQKEIDLQENDNMKAEHRQATSVAAS